MRQTHTISIVFDGHCSDMLEYLKRCGVVAKFYPPGLNSSGSTLLMVEDPNESTKLEEALDEIQLLNIQLDSVYSDIQTGEI